MSITDSSLDKETLLVNDSDVKMSQNINGGTSTGLIRKSNTRWIVIFLIGSLNVGYMYSSDYASTLSNNFLDDWKKTSQQLALFQTVYSFPNLILPLLSGLALDKFGPRICIILFCFVLLLGQAISTIGASVQEFGVILAGRTIFGFGAESLFVSINVITTQWFEGKELGLAFSLQTAFGMIVRSSASFLQNYIAGQTMQYCFGILWPLFVTTMTCLYSFGCALIYAYFDKKAEVQERRLGVFKKEEDQKFRMSDFKKLTFLFWILNIYDIFTIAESVSFGVLSYNFYKVDFGIPSKTTGLILSLTGILSLVTVLTLGQVFKKLGKYGMFLIISGILGILKYVLYLSLQSGNCWMVDNPTSPNDSIMPDCFGRIIPSIVVNALSSCIINIALFTSVALVVDPKVLGSAFGILDCFQMVGMLVMPLVGTAIQSHTNKWHGYFWFLIFFMLINGLNLLFAIWIFWYDMSHAKVLHDPEHNKMNFEDEVTHQPVSEEEVKINPKRSIHRQSFVQ